ncbi:START domain-containing protein [Thalassotalea psychrophila]|uniref:START domain-containing protein n=1 Tax=Thalassotalea psychrophila TaxID=3065647 RepID=A0ABY9U0J8_9GAMM|nr:START domain-containing protein [Colwelliaceae bacterium SQ149]
MKSYLVNILLLMFILLFTQQCQAEWQSYLNEKDFLIEYQKLENSKFTEINASIKIGGNIDDFFNILTSPKLAPIWLDKVISSELLTTLDDGSAVVLTLFESFGPVQSREMLVKSKVIKKTTDSLQINISGYNEYLPKNKNKIRVKKVKVVWRAQKLHNNNIKVSYRGSFDPAGSLPAWLSNEFALHSLENSFKKLRKLKPVNK